MIDLSTKTFFETVHTLIDQRPISRRRRSNLPRLMTLHSETYIHTQGRATDDPTEEVDEMAEHGTKRKQPDHQAVENKAPKRQNKKHKPRIHPKEAGHSIEDLPSLSQKTAESDKLSAAEILKSLGLEVSGAGKGAEVWFVGASEQTEGEKIEVDMPVEATETPSGSSGSGKTLK